MSDDLNGKVHPKRKPGLEAHLVDDQIVIFETGTDRVHYLNATAALILEFCDGNRSIADIVALVKEAYSLAGTPVDEVHAGLNKLIAEGLVHL